MIKIFTIIRQSLSSQKLIDTIIIAVCSFIILFMGIQLLSMEYGRDQGVFSTVADILAHNGSLYKDAWDLKPPGIYYVYYFAECIWGDTMLSIRLLELPALLSMLIAFIILSGRYINDWRPGLIAATFVMITTIEIGFWNTAQTETFGGICIIWGLVAAGSGQNGIFRLITWICFMIAGLFFTWSAFFKPTFCFTFIIGIFYSYFIISEPKKLSEFAIKKISFIGSAYVIGALIIIAINMIPLMISGSIHYAVDIYMNFLPEYISLSFQESSFLDNVILFFVRWPGIIKFIILPGLAIFLFIPGKNQKEIEGLMLFAGIILIILLTIILQGKFFEYHYNALIYMTLLISLWGYCKSLKYIKFKSPVIIFILLLYAFYFPRYELAAMSKRISGLLHPQNRIELNDKLYSIYDVNMETNRFVAHWIKCNTKAEDAIYIWGFESIIYDLSDRKPASRYIFNLAQRVNWTNDPARKELMRELQQTMPAVIVVVKNDRHFHITGNNKDSLETLFEFAALHNFIEQYYRYHFTKEDLDVYLLKDPVIE
ncbi:MAG: hypothetical protein JXJ04_15855 [Spirochaetales bacterium]|nr:hypothetical protein [Spirochaetales bacterium]